MITNYYSRNSDKPSEGKELASYEKGGEKHESQPAKNHRRPHRHRRGSLDGPHVRHDLHVQQAHARTEKVADGG